MERESGETGHHAHGVIGSPRGHDVGGGPRGLGVSACLPGRGGNGKEKCVRRRVGARHAGESGYHHECHGCHCCPSEGEGWPLGHHLAAEAGVGLERRGLRYALILVQG
jgi:hypothetical protein